MILLSRLSKRVDVSSQPMLADRCIVIFCEVDASVSTPTSASVQRRREGAPLHSIQRRIQVMCIRSIGMLTPAVGIHACFCFLRSLLYRKQATYVASKEAEFPPLFYVGISYSKIAPSSPFAHKRHHCQQFTDDGPISTPAPWSGGDIHLDAISIMLYAYTTRRNSNNNISRHRCRHSYRRQR